MRAGGLLGAGAWVALLGWATGEAWPPELSGVSRLPNGTHVLVNDETRNAVFLWDGNPAHLPERRRIDAALDDLEDVAVDSAGSVYLLTSHSLTRKGHDRPDRRRLARLAPRALEGSPSSDGQAVDVTAIDVVGDLTSPLLDLLAAGRAELNLEGLAWYPPSRLLLGARSPLRQGRAQVVDVGSVDRLFDPGRPRGSLGGINPRVVALDLGGRGIRGLAYDPWRRRIWVLAGDDGQGRSNGALFLWNPNQSAVQAVDAPDLAQVAQPEGVEVMGRPDPATDETQLLIVGEGASPLRLAARPRGKP